MMTSSIGSAEPGLPERTSEAKETEKQIFKHMYRMIIALCELDLIVQSTTGRSKLPGTDVSGLRVAGMPRASWAEVLFSSYRQKSYVK